MGSYIIKRLTSGIGIVLFILVLGMWMIEQIPGNYADSQTEVPPYESELRTVNKEDPLFYWTLIRGHELDKEWNPKWNGLRNEFHKTLCNYLQLHFGNSSIDGVPVIHKFTKAFPWSVAVQLPAILILLGLGLFFSIESTLHRDHWFIRLLDYLLMAFTSVPGFWLASLLLLFFANALFFKWFPTGMQSINHQNPFYCWWAYPSYFILPLVCLVVPSLAYLVRILRNGLKECMDSPHWIRAISTGMSLRRALFLEALPQAAIPMAAWMAGILPALFSGSILIEQIFSIPGLGRLLYMSIYARDWPVVQFLFFLSSGLTVLGFIISDVLIRFLDPRIKNKAL